MRQVPIMKILETRAHGNYNFYPVLDERLVFSDYPARARRGQLARLVSMGVMDVTAELMKRIIPAYTGRNY